MWKGFPNPQSDLGNLCYGLVHDWANWKRENGEAFAQLKSVLRELSPDPKAPMEPGELIRSSRQHTRDYPTLKSPSGQIVPRIHCVYSCFKLEDKSFPSGNRHGGQVDHFMPAPQAQPSSPTSGKTCDGHGEKLTVITKETTSFPENTTPLILRKIRQYLMKMTMEI